MLASLAAADALDVDLPARGFVAVVAADKNVIVGVVRVAAVAAAFVIGEEGWPDVG